MGCGSSSLKGDAPNDPNGAGDEMPPAKRVNTNFSEMNFDRGAAPDRRGTMAVAPHEQQDKISEDGPMQPKTPTKTEASAEKARQSHDDGAKLEPYKSLDGSGGASTEMKTLNQNMGDTSEIQAVGKSVNEEATAFAAGHNAATVKA